MVLSLAHEGKVAVAAAVAKRRPLFVGDALIDAGAENSPLHSCLILDVLGLKSPENEKAWRRICALSFRRGLNGNRGLIIVMYLFSTPLTSNLDFFLFFCFSFSSPTPISHPFRHLPSPNNDKDLDLKLSFVPMLLPIHSVLLQPLTMPFVLGFG